MPQINFSKFFAGYGGNFKLVSDKLKNEHQKITERNSSKSLLIALLNNKQCHNFKIFEAYSPMVLPCSVN